MYRHFFTKMKNLYFSCMFNYTGVKIGAPIGFFTDIIIIKKILINILIINYLYIYHALQHIVF